MTTGGAAAASSAARTRRNNNYNTSETPKTLENKRRRDGTSDDALKKKMLMYGDDANTPTMSNKEKEFFHHASTNTTTPYAMGEITSSVAATRHQHDDDDVSNNSSYTATSTWELGDPRNRDSRIGQIRDWCGWFVNCNVIQTIMTILILTNALLLGLLTFDNILESESLTHSLEALDLAILTAFTVEFSMQLIYLGFSLVQNNWLIFDCIVVSFSWIFLDSSVAVLRSFRIFRIFSLVSKWESLRILFAAVGKTMPKMASIWLALMIFFYIFCVLCTTLYADLYEDGYLDYDYFGRLDYTFLTLFQIMTLDSWTEVVRQVMKARPWAWLGFLAWVIITAFFVLNLVVAVICESLIELNKAKEQALMGVAIEENNNKAAASALQMEDLVRQQIQIMSVQQDLIRAQGEMQQTLNMIMCSMNRGGGGAYNPTGGDGSNFGGATFSGGGGSRSDNAMLLEQMISQEETSFHNSQDTSSFLHRFHSSSDSVVSSSHSRRLEEQ